MRKIAYLAIAILIMPAIAYSHQAITFKIKAEPGNNVRLLVSALPNKRSFDIIPYNPPAELIPDSEGLYQLKLLPDLDYSFTAEIRHEPKPGDMMLEIIKDLRVLTDE